MPISWNIPLVVLSILVAMMGSFTSLTHAQRMRDSEARRSWIWMLSGGLTLGVAIWTMHFIGMLAFHLPDPVSYDLQLTLLSIVPSIAAALLCFYLLYSHKPTFWRIAGGSFLMGLGISAMHYTGMAALKMSPPVNYSWSIVAVSILTAILASLGALLIVYSSEKNGPNSLLHSAGGGVLMGLAIAGMHYTGMAAAEFPAGSICLAGASRIEPDMLALLVSMGALFLFAGGMLAALFDQRMAWQKSQAMEQMQALNAELEQRAQKMADEMTRDLRSSRGMLNYILNAVPQSVFWKDRNSVFLGCNTVFARDAGLADPSEIIGKTDFDLPWTREESEAYRADDHEVMRRNSAKVHIIEHQQNAKGEHLWLDTTKVPLENSNGEVIGILGVYENISERKAIEEELRIAATTFETQEAILITDPKAKILRVNQAFQEITGYSADEVIGKNPNLLQSGRHDAAFYQAMWAALLSTGKWSGEVWDKRKNGEIYPKLMTITGVRDDSQQVTHYVAVFRDISIHKKSEQDIHQLAFFDPLTQLPNRRLLLDRLRQAMAASMRNGRYGALLFLDLDHFKTINDTQGHAVGDLLLIEVAQRLQTCVRASDSVARLGGDEFVVLLQELSSQADEAAAQTEQVAEKIRNELNQPYLLKNVAYHSTPSIGVSLFRGQQESVEDLLMHADVAMYQAKTAGRNVIRFFDPLMQTALDLRTAMEVDLRGALDDSQFLLYYQVQVDSRGKAIGAEALLRWQHPLRGFVFPDQFIPLAEETGLIVSGCGCCKPPASSSVPGRMMR